MEEVQLASVRRDSRGCRMKDRVPQRWSDPVVEVYKRDVDRTLLRENLRRTLDERFLGLKQMQRAAAELRRAMREARNRP